MLQHKTQRGLFKALSEPGEFQAVIASLGKVDADNDVIVEGAFEEGQEVRIAAWGHKWDVPAVGRGRIHADAREGWVDGRFFLNTTAGREHYETVKGLGPLQQWSFGYNVLDSAPGHFEGKQVRFLRQLKVFECSPVMQAAGVATRTTAIKSDGDDFAARAAAELLGDLAGLSVRKAQGEIARLGGPGALADDLNSVIAERELADLEHRVKATGAGQSRADRFIASLLGQDFSEQYARTMLSFETERVAQAIFVQRRPEFPIDYCQRLARAWMLRPA